MSTHQRAVLRDMRLVTIGIVLFLLRPVLHVVLMLIVFLRKRDYRFSAIAALMLTIVLVRFVLGMGYHRPLQGSLLRGSGSVFGLPTMQALVFTSIDTSPFLSTASLMASYID